MDKRLTLVAAEGKTMQKGDEKRHIVHLYNDEISTADQWQEVDEEAPTEEGEDTEET